MKRTRGVTRRVFLRLSAAVGAAGLLAACQSPSGRPGGGAGRADVGPRADEWERLVEAARGEGQVNLYGGQGQDNRNALVAPFERSFPGIRVNGTFGPGRDLVTRIASERTAGRNIADVLIGPGASGIFPLKPVGALAPLPPALVLPEVTDTSKWLDNKLWFLDAQEPYTTLAFEGDVNVVVTYNTRMVDPNEFTSYLDLLNPKWRGRMCATDVRTPGAGAVPTRFWYVHPELGPRFIERLFGEMDLTVSGDQRQMIDWVAQGTYPIGLLLNFVDVIPAIDQGLPIAMIRGDQFKEGAPLGPAGGTVSLVDSGPNRNAASVYVNWLLSREGQMSWQDNVKGNSLRIDIPKDKVAAVYVPKPGLSYLNTGAEEYAVLSGTEIAPLITRALSKS